MSASTSTYEKPHGHTTCLFDNPTHDDHNLFLGVTSAYAGGGCSDDTMLFLRETVLKSRELKWNGPPTYRVVGLNDEDRSRFIEEATVFQSLSGINFEYEGDTIGKSNLIFIFEYENIERFRSRSQKLYADVDTPLPASVFDPSHEKWIMIRKRYKNDIENYAMASLCFINGPKLTKSIAQLMWFEVFFSAHDKSDRITPSYLNNNGNDLDSISDFDSKLLRCFYSMGHDGPPDDLAEKLCECISE